MKADQLTSLCNALCLFNDFSMIPYLHKFVEASRYIMALSAQRGFKDQVKFKSVRKIPHLIRRKRLCLSAPRRHPEREDFYRDTEMVVL